MGAAAVPYIFVAVMAGSAVYAGYEKKQAGLAAKYDAQAKGKQEAMAARDQEIARRQRLLKSLAERSALTGAQGTTFEGSPSALLINDFRNYELENTTARAQNAATQSALKTAGANYERIGNIGFYGGLLNAAGSVAGAGFGGGGTTTPTGGGGGGSSARINR